MTAKVIADDSEALAVAAALAEEFRVGAPEQDAERRLPWDELDRLSASGPPAVTVPAAYGGADVRQETLAEIFGCRPRPTGASPRSRRATSCTST